MSNESQYYQAFKRERDHRKNLERYYIKRINELKKKVISQQGKIESLKSMVKDGPEDQLSMIGLALDVPSPVGRLDEEGNLMYANHEAQLIFNVYSNPASVLQNLISSETIKQLKYGKTDSFTTVVDVHEYVYKIEFFWDEFNGCVNMYGENITGNVMEEFAMQMTEKKYRNIIESLNDFIFEINLDGRFIFVNKAGKSVTGYSEDELMSMSLFDLIVMSHRKDAEQFFKDCVKMKRKNSNLEIPIETKSGVTRWLGFNVIVNDRKELETNAIFLVVARDISLSKEFDEKIERNEQVYQQIIENLKLGFMEVDGDGRIIRVHKGMSQITGYSDKELIGKRPYELFLVKESREVMLNNFKLRKSGKSTVYEVQIKRKDGKYRWVMISGTPMYDESGVFIGSSAIFQDLTARVRLENRLRKARKDALNSLKTKETFLANISHEMRTPLNAIIGFSEFLENALSNNVHREKLSIVKESAKHLLAVINDLLDYSKIEADKIKLENRVFSLDRLLKRIYETFVFRAEEKGIKLIYNCPKEELYVRSDPTRLTQILNNLLSNSTKFTKEGQVQFTMKIKSQKENECLAYFEVSDSGIGIKKGKLATVFKQFEQADKSIEREFGGTGLGLSISKGLVELLGGELTLDSKVGKGTTAYFTIPLQIIEKSDATESHEPQEVQFEFDLNKENRCVLVVDDNELNVKLLELLLEQANVPYKSALGGKESLEMVDDSIALVLMDIQMPGINGVDAMRKMKKRFPELPIVAVTANAFPGQRELHLQQGFDDYLTKPFSRGNLSIILQRFISSTYSVESSKEGMDQELEDTKKAQDMENESIEIVDLDTLAKVSGRSDFVEEMVTIFLKSLNEFFKGVELTGDEQADYQKIKKLCHKMRPSLEYLGLGNAYDIAQAIDDPNEHVSKKTIEKQLPELVSILKHNQDYLQERFR